MGRFAYVNGHYVRERDAEVSAFDRGFLFADGVYEVSAILNGRMVDNDLHLARLDRSLGELQIDWPMSERALLQVQHELIRRNRTKEGLIYLQVTRGAAPRDFKFPEAAVPSLFMFTQERKLRSSAAARSGVSVVTMPDIRWKRPDIKSIALLPQALGKQQAAEEGAFEGWMVDDKGFVTEGTSSNAWIVTHDGVIRTRPAREGSGILAGITRQSIIRLAKETGIKIEEKAFTPAEAYNAAEAMMTSAGAFVVPIVRIDGRPVGTGSPGPVAPRLREIYLEMADEQTRRRPV
ncbi:D-amino-acid transaminase [Radicibacter daui]|uniref:D-amino-acid transaminase n=1 Tax=Radicibacter daui TaxID=3064829 RepID=UPI004046EFDE